MPQISVIVPVYKVEPYLHRCVDSILGQSFTDFELILVDDGSPDHCGAICDEYAAKDSRIHVIHQQNGGLSAARNAGIDWAFANSDSQWLSFIDSDDWVHRDYLSILIHAAVSHGVSISKCEYIPVNPETHIPAVSNVDVQVMKAADAFLLKNSGVCAPAKLFRKVAFLRIRFPVGKLHEDMFTTYKVLFQYESIAVVDVPLYYYWSNCQSITKSSWRPQRLDEFEAFEEVLSFLKERRYEKTYEKLVNLYMAAIAEQYYAVEKSNIDKKHHYKKIIQAKMRTVIFRNLRITTIDWKKKEWCFGVAFPLAMNLYWYWKALIDKVVRMNK